MVELLRHGPLSRLEISYTEGHCKVPKLDSSPGRTVGFERDSECSSVKRYEQATPGLEVLRYGELDRTISGCVYGYTIIDHSLLVVGRAIPRFRPHLATEECQS